MTFFNKVCVLLAGFGALSCKDSISSAVDPGGDFHWTMVTAGGGDFTGFSCGVAETGKAYCWGALSSAAINDSTGPRTPAAVRGGLLFRSVDAGYQHACGIATDGAQYCWGGWDFVQLGGDGSTPQRMGTAMNYNFLATDVWTACALTADADALCWDTRQNADDYGHTRAPAHVGGMIQFKDIAVGGFGGENFWCGLATDGAAYCWGSNRYGALGDSARATSAKANQPNRVVGGQVFKMISGGSSMCGLTNAGDTYCWGYPPFADFTANKDVPTKLSGGAVFVTISVGESHACGLKSDGSLWCWGTNSRGELGNSGSSGASVPQIVSGGFKFRSVSAGNEHTCAVTTDGIAYCWGRNDQGQLGNGSLDTRSGQFSSVPVRVHSPLSL